jgi:hypothetical protein
MISSHCLYKAYSYVTLAVVSRIYSFFPLLSRLATGALPGALSTIYYIADFYCS